MDKPVILTSLTDRAPVDVIYPASGTDCNWIIRYLQRNHVGFTFVSEEDAAKLLLEHGGIGIRCYLPDLTGNATEYRSVEAQLRYIDLSSITGLIQIEPAVALVHPVVDIKRNRLHIAA